MGCLVSVSALLWPLDSFAVWDLPLPAFVSLSRNLRPCEELANAGRTRADIHFERGRLSLLPKPYNTLFSRSMASQIRRAVQHPLPRISLSSLQERGNYELLQPAHGRRRRSEGLALPQEHRHLHLWISLPPSFYPAPVQCVPDL